MIKIENKTTEIKKNNEDFMTYADLAMVCVDKGSQEGYTAEQIRKLIRVLDVLEKATDTIELEDADYETLKEQVETMKWALVHKDIVAFTDDIINITK